MQSSSSMHGPLVAGREEAPRRTKALETEHVIVDSITMEHVLASAIKLNQNQNEAKSRAEQAFPRGARGQARSPGRISLDLLLA